MRDAAPDGAKLRRTVAAFPGRGFAVLDGARFAFLAVDHGGVRRVVADPALPSAPSGLLTIRSDQIED